MVDLGSIPIDVELRLNGKPITGALVVGPDDHLVINLGQSLSHQQLRDMRVDLVERWPAMADRVVLVGAESLAVVRAAPDA